MNLDQLQWISNGERQVFDQLANDIASARDELQRLDDESNPGLVTVALDKLDHIEGTLELIAVGTNVGQRAHQLGGDHPVTLFTPPGIPDGWTPPGI